MTEMERTKAEFLTEVCFEALKKATVEEEKKVLKRKIVEMVTPLVVSIANKYKDFLNSFNGYEDAINEGILGVYDAIEHYDIEKKQAKFVTFCHLYIKGAICAYIDNNKELAHYPAKFFQDVSKVNMWLQNKHAVNYEHVYNNYDALYEKAVKEVTLSAGPSKALRIERALRYALSLAYRSIEDDTMYTAKKVTGYTAKDLFSTKDMENRIILENIHKKLSEEEKQVFCLLYQEYKKREIAEMLGFTLSKVSTIIKHIQTKAAA